MVSKAFKLASLTTNVNVAGTLTAGVVGTYTTINDLPASGNTQGDMAFVDSSNKLYFYRTEGWYRIELDSALS